VVIASGWGELPVPPPHFVSAQISNSDARRKLVLTKYSTVATPRLRQITINAVIRDFNGISLSPVSYNREHVLDVDPATYPRRLSSNPFADGAILKDQTSRH